MRLPNPRIARPLHIHSNSVLSTSHIAFWQSFTKAIPSSTVVLACCRADIRGYDFDDPNAAEEVDA